MSRHHPRRAVFAAGLAALILGPGILLADTIYVTPGGTDATGPTWAAPTSLTNALAICTADDEIWVAEGTYTDGATFTVGANCTLYGGFTNGMATRAERDWDAHPAVLDGQGADRRVVTVSGADVTLDGLVVTDSDGVSAGGILKTVVGDLVVANCRLQGHSGNGHGRGGYFTAGSVFMTNCVVADNTLGTYKKSGFGIYSSGADLALVDCLITNNYGSGVGTREARGVGLYFDAGTLMALRTDFIDNQGGANKYGGGAGVYLGSSASTDASFSHCVFRGNAALINDIALPGYGGAMWVNLAAAATARVVNCTFTDNVNWNGDGGAVYLSGGTLILKNSILWTNAVDTGYTGNEICRGGGTLIVDHCDLTGLTSPHVVGQVTLTHCLTSDPLFSGTTDLHLRSATGRWDSVAGTFVTTDTEYSPCLDAGDPDGSVGDEIAPNGNIINLGAYGGTAQASKSPPNAAPMLEDAGAVTNWNRATVSGALTNDTYVTATVTLCYGTNSVVGDTTTGWEYVDVLDAPQHTGSVFSVTTPALAISTTYTYRWYATNAHGTDWTPAATFDTGAMPPGGGADVIHIDRDAVGAADGTDWANAFPRIMDAVLALEGTRTNIWMTGVTYNEGGLVTVSEDATLVGGFVGTETAVSERALTNAVGVVTNYTVINGEGSHRCFSITAGDVSMESLVFTNCTRSQALAKSGSGALTMVNCRIEGNSGTTHGLGCYFTAGSVLMTNCVVADNQGDRYGQYGLGIYSSGADLQLLDCLITNNGGSGISTRQARGVGLYFDAGTLTVLRTDFIDNQGGANKGGGGAGVYLGPNASTDASFSHCVFRGNAALINDIALPGYGGAMWVNLAAGAQARVANCTFTDNANLNGNGGAIYLTQGTLTLKNSILWTNAVGAGFTGSELYQAGGTLDATYCDLTGLTSPHVVGATLPASCQAADPLFASATDLHLQSPAGRWDPSLGDFVTTDPAYSPCIDAGDDSDPVGDEPTDNGNDRINLGVYGGTGQASKSPPAAVPLLADRGYTVNHDRAEVSGELTNDTLVAAQIYLCYGTSSIPSDTTNGWDEVTGLGEKNSGAVFSTWTPNLLPTTTYHYRWYAVNGDGSNWTAPASFVSGTASPGGGADVIHVDLGATGAEDGSDWAHAYTKIVDAVLALEGPWTNIWMTGGTYNEGGLVTVSEDATLVGGFVGTEAAVSERALTNAVGVVTNYTVINGEDSHRCFSITAGDVSLDSLVFTDCPIGQAFAKSGSGRLEMENCRIEGNSGSTVHGLGCYFTAGSVLMTHCVVADNQGLRYGLNGFGIYSSGADLQLLDCLVTNNHGEGHVAREAFGVGLYFDAGTLTALRTDFIDNQAGANRNGGGAGVYLGPHASTDASFSHCVFRGNAALVYDTTPGYGGAMWANLAAAATARVVNCTFTDNANLNGNGGAIYLTQGTLTLKNSILWTNAVGTGYTGGELYQAGGTLDATYCDLTGLTSPHVVGATLPASCQAADPLFASATDLHLRSPAGRWDPSLGDFVTTDPAYSPCIDAGDDSDPVGDEPTDNGNDRINLGAYGGTGQASKSPPAAAPLLAGRGYSVNHDRAEVSGELTNDTLVAAQIYLCYGTSSIPGDTTNGWDEVTGLGEKNNGVVFSTWSPNLLPTTTYHYRWYAVNGNGSNWTAAATFDTGTPAPGGGTDVIHVDSGATGAEDGSDWAHAYTKIMDAVLALEGTRTNIWMTGVTYNEGGLVTVSEDATLVGGFVGTEAAVSERALTNAVGVVTNYTVINGEGSHRCFSITAGDVSLESLVFTNCTIGQAFAKSGSGRLEMENCRIEGNSGSTVHGLGCYFTAGSVLMTHCVVADNQGLRYGLNGFGIFSSGADLALVDCLLTNNYGAGAGTRYARGVGLYFDAGTLTALRTDFIDNKGGANHGGGGGGVYLGSSAVFSNCVFRGNAALINDTTPGYGGAMWVNLAAAAKARVVNCTFTDNANSNGNGGAIYLTQGTLTLKNSILWTNAVGTGYTGSEIYKAGGTLAATYCDLTGLTSPHVVGATLPASCQAADPLFASATDVHLQSTGGRWDPAVRAFVATDDVDSPCIDAGDPTDDVGDEQRPNGYLINMGAYGGTAEASLTYGVSGTVFVIR